MQTFFWLDRHAILPKERRLKRAVKNIDQSQHTSRSMKCTLDFAKVGDRLRKVKKKVLLKGKAFKDLQSWTKVLGTVMQ